MRPAFKDKDVLQFSTIEPKIVQEYFNAISNVDEIELSMLFNKYDKDINQIQQNGEYLVHTLVEVSRDRAREEKILRILKLLHNRGLNLNITNNNNDSPLHLAVKHGYTEIAKYLIDNGVNITMKNKDGLTIMHYLANGVMNEKSFIKPEQDIFETQKQPPKELVDAKNELTRLLMTNNDEIKYYKEIVLTLKKFIVSHNFEFEKYEKDLVNSISDIVNSDSTDEEISKKVIDKVSETKKSIIEFYKSAIKTSLDRLPFKADLAKDAINIDGKPYKIMPIERNLQVKYNIKYMIDNATKYIYQFINKDIASTNNNFNKIRSQINKHFSVILYNNYNLKANEKFIVDKGKFDTNFIFLDPNNDKQYILPTNDEIDKFKNNNIEIDDNTDTNYFNGISYDILTECGINLTGIVSSPRVLEDKAKAKKYPLSDDSEQIEAIVGDDLDSQRKEIYENKLVMFKMNYGEYQTKLATGQVDPALQTTLLSQEYFVEQFSKKIMSRPDDGVKYVIEHMKNTLKQIEQEVVSHCYIKPKQQTPINNIVNEIANFNQDKYDVYTNIYNLLANIYINGNTIEEMIANPALVHNHLPNNATFDQFITVIQIPPTVPPAPPAPPLKNHTWPMIKQNCNDVQLLFYLDDLTHDHLVNPINNENDFNNMINVGTERNSLNTVLFPDPQQPQPPQRVPGAAVGYRHNPTQPPNYGIHIANIQQACSNLPTTHMHISFKWNLIRQTIYKISTILSSVDNGNNQLRNNYNDKQTILATYFMPKLNEAFNKTIDKHITSAITYYQRDVIQTILRKVYDANIIIYDETKSSTELSTILVSQNELNYQYLVKLGQHMYIDLANDIINTLLKRLNNDRPVSNKQGVEYTINEFLKTANTPPQPNQPSRLQNIIHELWESIILLPYAIYGIYPIYFSYTLNNNAVPLIPNTKISNTEPNNPNNIDISIDDSNSNNHIVVNWYKLDNTEYKKPIQYLSNYSLLKNLLFLFFKLNHKNVLFDKIDFSKFMSKMINPKNYIPFITDHAINKLNGLSLSFTSYLNYLMFNIRKNFETIDAELRQLTKDMDINYRITIDNKNIEDIGDSTMHIMYVKRIITIIIKMLNIMISCAEIERNIEYVRVKIKMLKDKNKEINSKKILLTLNL